MDILSFWMSDSSSILTLIVGLVLIYSLANIISLLRKVIKCTKLHNMKHNHLRLYSSFSDSLCRKRIFTISNISVYLEPFWDVMSQVQSKSTTYVLLPHIKRNDRGKVGPCVWVVLALKDWGALISKTGIPLLPKLRSYRVSWKILSPCLKLPYASRASGELRRLSVCLL